MADNNDVRSQNRASSGYNKREEEMSKKNPRNRESPLYVGLTRLFSGPLITFRTQQQNRYKRRDLDRFKFTSTSGQAFKKKSYNPFEAIQSNIMANQTRAERYSDFDQMEFTPEIASAMDIYADEMTISNNYRNVITIETRNEEIKGILHNLYYNTLNLESNLFSWCRTMCKFGDFFLYLDIDEKLGIKGVLALPSPEVERLEGQDETNPNYIQFQWNSAGLTFENWQIAHFRILGQDKYAPYGTSILEPARRIWRQLQLMEDAMMAYRIVRAPDRRVFYIDVGNISPTEIEQFMQKIITQMKRNQIVDPNTGRVDLRYNPMSIDEDYFLPVRGTSTGTRIETLPGGQFQGDIDDIEYLRDKLFSALKIPQVYLARGKEGSEDKTTLSQKDIRFAKTVQRLQRVLVNELEKIGIIHLYVLGYRNQDLLNFKIKLNNPSKISEMQEIEYFKAQLEVAGSAKEVGFSKRWIYENIFRMNDDDFLRIQRDLFYDKQFEKSVEAGEATDTGAVGGSTLNTDLGAAPAGADVPAGGPTGEEGGESSGGEEASSEPESALLAAPGRREDGSYTREDWNGAWHKQKAIDGRETSGPRQRSNDARVKPEQFRKTNRNLFAGLNTLRRSGKGIFSEEVEENIEDQEKMLLEMENKLQTLSKTLLKEDKKKEDK